MRNSHNSGNDNEGYVDPLFVNKQKLEYDLYPDANGTIYGCDSNIFTGHTFYNKAY
jgi:hypothetical protein